MKQRKNRPFSMPWNRRAGTRAQPQISWASIAGPCTENSKNTPSSDPSATLCGATLCDSTPLRTLSYQFSPNITYRFKYFFYFIRTWFVFCFPPNMSSGQYARQCFDSTSRSTESGRRFSKGVAYEPGHDTQFTTRDSPLSKSSSPLSFMAWTGATLFQFMNTTIPVSNQPAGLDSPGVANRQRAWKTPQRNTCTGRS